MKILFAMSSPEYLRFYDGTIRQLAERGHDVVIAVNAINEGKPVRFDAIGGSSRISGAGLLPARDDKWSEFARGIRGTMDFVRYLHPSLAGAAVLRARMKRQALPWVLQWADGIRELAPRRVAAVMRGLERVERAIPPAKALVRYLDELQPDLVIVSPLVEAASDQVDLVKAAQALGIRTAAAIASWDNLTNKGDIRLTPDLVIVWNEAQRREAIELHRVPPARVAVTGAQLFDRWFDRAPSRSREAFCRTVGLPADRPFVLYVGSSVFISRADAEMPFVRRWIDALRASGDPAVRGLAVLVRPHPYNGSAWRAEEFAGLPDVAVWPRGGYNPVEEQNRADFFDSLYHSAAVVGINTSAMIEAAIVGRPVLSIVSGEFAQTQEGTLHFRHLLPENGGFLRVASSVEEHVSQLASLLHEPAAARMEIGRFVASFVRPHGVDRPCTPVVVEAIEQQGLVPAPRRTRVRGGSVPVRSALLPLAWLGGRVWAAPSRQKALRGKRGHRRARGSTKDAAPRITRLAALLPVTIATAAAALFAVLDAAGHTPFAYPVPRNIAEAAGMGAGATVLHMLRDGADPNEVLPVRPEIISSSVTRATAVEAAVWGRRLELLRLLEREHAIADGSREYIACLATIARVSRISEYFAPSGVTGCDETRVLRTLEGRAR